MKKKDTSAPLGGEGSKLGPKKKETSASLNSEDSSNSSGGEHVLAVSSRTRLSKKKQQRHAGEEENKTKEDVEIKKPKTKETGGDGGLNMTAQASPDQFKKRKTLFGSRARGKSEAFKLSVVDDKVRGDRCLLIARLIS